MGFAGALRGRFLCPVLAAAARPFCALDACTQLGGTLFHYAGVLPATAVSFGSATFGALVQRSWRT